MMRRALFRLAATLPVLGPHGDGLARPVNAPPARPPSPGVQPGTSTPVIITNRVIIAGPGGELLVYSGTPALNNLLASIVATNTTDAPGNNLLPVIAAYANLGVGSYTAGQLQGNGIVIEHATAQNQPYSEKAHALWSDQFTTPGFQVRNATSGAALQLLDSVQETMAVGPLVAQDPANAGVPESWHSLGTLAGFTVTRGRYRLTAAGETEFDVFVVAGGANAGSVAFSNALPAAYQPLAGTTYTFPLATGRAVTAGEQYARLSVTGGTVTLVANAANVTNSYSGVVTMPLN